MKVIENKDCRVITTTQQGLVLVEDSGVIIQIDQQVILRAAENLGLFNYYIAREPDEVEKVATQLESALATNKQADETIKNLKSCLADKQIIVSKHLKKIKEQEQLLKEKNATIETLRKDIADGNNLINELEFQRNSARDSVTQLEKRLEAYISTITEKNELLGKLSKRIQDYENNNKYIERYSLVNNDTVILDCSFEHEPMVCINSETARKALEELFNGADYNELYDGCESSAYLLCFYDDHVELIEVGTNNLIILNNKTIATNLYRLLKCGYITMDDIKELTKTDNK